VQQIISKGFVIVKEVLSDLFELRNVVNLKKNSLQKKWKFLGGGGSTNDPLEGKFQGGGG